MILKTLFPLAAVALVISGCGQDKTAITGKGDTLVSVNGVELKESLIEPQLNQIPPQLMQGRENDIKQQLLSRVIEQEVARQEAERLNVMDVSTYHQQLENFKTQLKINLLMQKKLEDTVTDEAVRAAYEKTKGNYAYPAVHARHILVKTEKEANDILKVATPENFAELAKEKSEGPSAKTGGDLGYFRKEAMVPAFAEVAFATAKGKVAAKPVNTQFGWHVIYVEDKQDKYVPTLDMVAPQIRQQLSQTVLQGYMKELMSKANIVYAESLKASEAKPEPAAGQ